MVLLKLKEALIEINCEKNKITRKDLLAQAADGRGENLCRIGFKTGTISCRGHPLASLRCNCGA